MAKAAEKQFGQRINIETGSALMVDIEGLDSKVKCQLIGFIHNEFLIISAPVGVTGIRDKLFEGNKLTLRYLHGGHVFGFETQIISMISKPRSMLILHYPSKLASSSLRKSERFDCFIICTMQIEGKAYPGTIMDISVRGCLCLIPELPEMILRTINKDGLEAMLNFDAPNDKNSMAVPIKVVNQNEYKSASKLGVLFNGLDEEIDRQIVRICEYLERQ